MSSQNTQLLPKIELYYFTNASSLAIHTLLIEADLPFDAHEVTTSADSQAKLLHVSPKGRVPVLVLKHQSQPTVNATKFPSTESSDRIVTITETLAIATAISDLVPDKHLLGVDNIQKARVYEWLSWMMSSVHATGWVTVFRPERFLGPAADEHDALVEAQLKDRIRKQGLLRLRRMYEQLEMNLAEQGCGDGTSRRYAVGDHLTAVDGLLYVLFRWATQWGVVVGGGSHARYWTMMARFEQTAATKRALTEEGLSPITSKTNA